VVDGKPKTEQHVAAWINSSIRYQELTAQLTKRIQEHVQRCLEVEFGEITPVHQENFVRKVQEARWSSRKNSLIDAKVAASSSSIGRSMRSSNGLSTEEIESIKSRKDVSISLHSVMSLAEKGFQRVTDSAVNGLAGFVVSICKEEFKSLFSPSWLKIVSQENCQKPTATLNIESALEPPQLLQLQLSNCAVAATPTSESGSIPFFKEEIPAVVQIAQELQLAMVDYAALISDEKVQSQLAERLVMRTLKTYFSQFAASKRRLTDDQRTKFGSGISADLDAMKSRLKDPSGIENNKAEVYAFEDSMLNNCFDKFMFVSDFLNEQDPEKAAVALTNALGTIITEFNAHEGLNFVTGMSKLRPDLSAQWKLLLQQEFQYRLSNHEEETEGKSVDTIAQRLRLPWASLSNGSPSIESDVSSSWLSNFGVTVTRSETEATSHDPHVESKISQNAPPPSVKPDDDTKEQSAATAVKKTSHVRSNTMDTDIDAEIISLDDFLS